MHTRSPRRWEEIAVEPSLTWLLHPLTTGFVPQYDPHDVLVLQIQGCKTWHPTDVRLEAGEALYLPRGSTEPFRVRELPGLTAAQQIGLARTLILDRGPDPGSVASVTASHRGAGAMRAGGAAQGADSGQVAGLITLAGGALTGGPSMPMMPSNWPPETDEPGP